LHFSSNNIYKSVFIYIVGKCAVQISVLSKTSKVGLKTTSLLHVNKPLQIEGGCEIDMKLSTKA